MADELILNPAHADEGQHRNQNSTIPYDRYGQQCFQSVQWNLMREHVRASLSIYGILFKLMLQMHKYTRMAGRWSKYILLKLPGVPV